MGPDAPEDAEHAQAAGGGRALPEDRLESLLLEGARLFDAGRFFESHEAWEFAWHGAPEPERDFFQGLIHAAAACLHHQRGNGYGYTRQLERLQRRLGQYVPRHRQVETQALIDAVQGLPEPGQKAEYPRLGLQGPLGRD